MPSKLKKRSMKGPGARVAAVSSDIVQRLVQVRAVYLAILNDPNLPPGDPVAAVEFQNAVGEILEAKPIKEVHFNRINRGLVLRLLKHNGE